MVMDYVEPRMSDTRPKPPEFKGQWYSICSAHGTYNPDCGNCNAGRWVSDSERELSHWLWNYSQRIWRKWANRKPDTMLEALFPKLHGTHQTSTCPACGSANLQDLARISAERINKFVQEHPLIVPAEHFYKDTILQVALEIAKED